MCFVGKRLDNLFVFELWRFLERKRIDERILRKKKVVWRFEALEV